ncbi:MAG: hypothetical protein ACI8QZ_000548 [Chlamydiales bacterium]
MKDRSNAESPGQGSRGGRPASLGGRAGIVALLSIGWLAMGAIAGGDLALIGKPPLDDPSPPAVRYGRDVRRILSTRCFQCHGADSGARQANLRLDQREGALGGKYPAIVPGDLDESELWWRITSDDPNEMMPPPEAKKRALSQADLDILKRWIEGGAEYEPHWAFVAPDRPASPVVERDDWARGDIDRFILAALEARNLSPSPEADRATLVRRVYLDLTGLPPTLEELDTFLADDDPQAYESLVDRILGTEPFTSRVAERLATWWMDAARYADTSGIHTDNGRQMWLWRDWVLAALRDNMPFDRFVIEQLAGDLLPDATTAQRIASGFNRNHISTDEGGAIAEEYLVEYAIDRANTTASVFLGLTMGCARCHDHKFDPTTQEDYYSMVGFFNSIEEPGLYSQTANPNRAYEPFLEVPSAEQQVQLDQLAVRHTEVTARMLEPLPGEDAQFRSFVSEIQARAGVEWSIPTVLSASSSDHAVTLELREDRSILATGPVSDFEDYTIVLRSEASDLRSVLLEALATPNPDPDSTAPDGAGRASHGNAVVSHLTLDVRPVDESVDWTPVPLSWAWADHAQRNGDFEAGNVIEPDDRGWAADGNANGGARDVLLLAEGPFGFAGGTDLRVTLHFRSKYAQHSLGRVRLRVSPLTDTSLLPVALGRWYVAGPFIPAPEGDREAAYSTVFGPEAVAALDPLHDFGEGLPRWEFQAKLVDGEPVALSAGVGASYLGRTIWSPDARSVDLHLGSDDGFALFLNGERVGGRMVDRGVAADQDQVRVDLQPGANMLVFEIINTGGPSGYAFDVEQAAQVLEGELPSALLERGAIPENQRAQLTEAWRRRFFDGYRALDDERVVIEESQAAVEARIPRTMVMQELEQLRPSFVLKRGQYDSPDEERQVERRPPAFLSPLPVDAPRDRLGLAQWLVAPDNALFSRVAVNRFWQLMFGSALVRTSEDFGLQGEWPTHPELLDWLAVEFRESGWDVRALLRSIVVSSTYRQASVGRAELLERDPSDRWLARYPRRRLSAEQIRDHALYTSGLLVERFGGASVKPYQPEGLWREVAMLASNTRLFEVGAGDDLWRRSLYTYWKRAVPPPAMQAFDAPTRESCVVRRQSTNTPLQALVLWNDEQFVEAARMLAARALEDELDDSRQLARLFRMCTSREPEAVEVEALVAALEGFRRRFRESPEDAAALLEVGAAPVPDGVDPVELGAWTLIANAVLNLHETLTQD